MPIVKVFSRKEEYRVYATTYLDSNEMSGRGRNKELTERISKNIFNKIRPFIKDGFKILDFGCGNAELLKIIDKGIQFNIKLIGTSPTDEEVIRLRREIKSRRIQLIRLEAKQLIRRKDCIDIIIANSVLLLMDDIDIQAFLFNSHKRLGINGVLYLGEIPEFDELSDKLYGDSIYKWILYILNTRGYRNAIKEIIKILICRLSREVFLIVPKKVWYIEKEKFVARVESLGFKLLSDEINKLYPPELRDKPNFQRRDYVFQKIS